jgi:hypothetical protein
MAVPTATADQVLVAGALANVPVNAAQADAIVETITHFESDETPCLGLKSWHIAGEDNALAYRPLLSGDDAFVEVHFHYLSEDPRQIESAPLGLEVTLFNPDGTVRSSQDFG